MDPNNLHTANEIEDARAALAYLIARYDGGSIQFHETDNDSHNTHVSVPQELAHEVMGAVYGMLTTRLIALGVKVPEIQNRECFECGGSGEAKK